MILDKEVEEFLTKNAEAVQEVLIHDVKDNFVEKKGNELVWKNSVRIRLQEISDAVEIERSRVAKIINKYFWNEYTCDYDCSKELLKELDASSEVLE